MNVYISTHAYTHMHMHLDVRDLGLEADRELCNGFGNEVVVSYFLSHLHYPHNGSLSLTRKHGKTWSLSLSLPCLPLPLSFFLSPLPPPSSLSIYLHTYIPTCIIILRSSSTALRVCSASARCSVLMGKSIFTRNFLYLYPSFN